MGSYIGKMGFLTPYISGRDERILMKLEIYNYVGDPTTHAKNGDDRATWVVSAHARFVKSLAFVFFFFVFFLFIGSHSDRTARPILTNDGSKCVVWAKDVPFGGHIITTSGLGVLSPQKRKIWGRE